MKNVLIEAGPIEMDNIEKVEYNEATNEIMVKTKAEEHIYKVEQTVETYILNYEDPLYVNNVAKEVKK